MFLVNRSTRKKRSAIGFAAAGATLALTGTLLMAAPAFAADEPGIFGYTDITLDFTNPKNLVVEITTTNLSDGPAWGTAYVVIPSGARYDFGPSRYAAGETRTFAAALPGHPCADAKLMSAAAFGYADGSDATPEWTSGVVRYPDPRVTVTGCHSTRPDADADAHPDDEEHPDANADDHPDADGNDHADADTDDHADTDADADDHPDTDGNDDAGSGGRPVRQHTDWRAGTDGHCAGRHAAHRGIGLLRGSRGPVRPRTRAPGGMTVPGLHRRLGTGVRSL